MAELFGIAVARQQLADALAEQLAEFKYDIFPNPQSLNTITKPTLLLQRTSFERVAQGLFSNTFTLFVIEPAANTKKSEDALDQTVENVTAALDLAKVQWTGGRRSTWGDSNPSYEITLITNSKRKNN